MHEKKGVADKISKLREEMYRLIEEKPALIDKEIVDISQKLDKLLNEYHQLERKKVIKWNQYNKKTK